MNELLLILLPIAAGIGWYYGNSKRRVLLNSHLNQLSRDYFIGLNFLLNEQPDKAVDIFIKLLTVDSETVETHLALGNLFRRRGEIDRAIRVHQNIIARPTLEPQQRIEALAALAHDYYRAGVLDRAERLFLEVLAIIPDDYSSLVALLDIYQQQKRWEQAVNTAEKVEPTFKEKLNIALAHYYCELAHKAYAEQHWEKANESLQLALANDPKCVRANIMMGDYALQTNHINNALKFYQQVLQQDNDYLAEILPAVVACYQAQQDLIGLKNYLEQCLQEFPSAAVVVALADIYCQIEGPEIALRFVAGQLKRRPSLKGLLVLIDLQLKLPQNTQREDLHDLRELVAGLLKNKPIYRCIQCGLASKKLHWQCPSCKGWSVVKRIQGIEGE